MIFALVTLAASLATTEVPASLAIEAALDVWTVVLEEPPLLATREQTARLLLVWSWRESRWQTDAHGDKGQSLGVMQMRREWLGDQADHVLADRRLALRLGLSLMRRLAAQCGSVRAGLRAYADGTCAGSMRARDLVSARCALAGGC